MTVISGYSLPQTLLRQEEDDSDFNSDHLRASTGEVIYKIARNHKP